MVNKAFLSLSFIVLIVTSCLFSQDKENFEWNAAACGPANYNVTAPHIFFYSNGALVINTGSMLGATHWAYPDDVHYSHEEIPLPDSVFVSYEGLNDKNEAWLYEGGSRLPKEKFLKIFNEGYAKKGETEYPQYITAGLAPGGRICIWADPVEVMRFTVPAKEKVSNKRLYTPDEKKEKTDYINHHPIDYSIWEKPDKRYELDFGFCLEAPDIKCGAIYAFSKEGIREVIANVYMDSLKWGEPFGENLIISGIIITYNWENKRIIK